MGQPLEEAIEIFEKLGVVLDEAKVLELRTRYKDVSD